MRWSQPPLAVAAPLSRATSHIGGGSAWVVRRQATTMRNLIQKGAEYYAAARHRAQRRKSAWNALLIPFCFGGWLVVWYGLFRLVWLFHVAIYPEHQFRDFWQAGISFWSFVPSFLMVFSLMPGAIVVGFMLGNILLWLIAPARRIFEAESRGYAGTSFRDSMRGLFRFGVWLLPIGLVIAFAAAYFLKSLR